MVKTLQQVRAEFLSAGISVAEWVRVNGFTRETVVDLLRGQSKGLRGEAHRAAVALGLKCGHVTRASQFNPAASSSRSAPQPEGTAPMQGILYRALATRRDTIDPELWVFFECPPLLHPGTELARMLAAAWWTTADQIEICNVNSERSLFSDWCWSESASTGDARLFECGTGDGGLVHYIPHERTLFLVGGATLQRLAKALRRADHLSEIGFKAPRTAHARPGQEMLA